MDILFLLFICIGLSLPSLSSSIDSYRKVYDPGSISTTHNYISMAIDPISFQILGITDDYKIVLISPTNEGTVREELLAEARIQVYAVVPHRNKFAVVTARCVYWVYHDGTWFHSKGLGPCEMLLHANSLEDSSLISIESYFNQKRLRPEYLIAVRLFKIYAADPVIGTNYFVSDFHTDHIIIVFPNGTIISKTIYRRVDENWIIESLIFSAGYLYVQAQGVFVRARSGDLNDLYEGFFYEKIKYENEITAFADGRKIGIVTAITSIAENIVFMVYRFDDVSFPDCYKANIFNMTEKNYDEIVYIAPNPISSYCPGNIFKSGTLICRQQESNSVQHPWCFYYAADSSTNPGLRKIFFIEYGHPGPLDPPSNITFIDNKVCWENEHKFRHAVHLKIQNSQRSIVDTQLEQGAKCYHNRTIPRGQEMALTIKFITFMEDRLERWSQSFSIRTEYIFPPRNIYYYGGYLHWTQEDENRVESYKIRCLPDCPDHTPSQLIMNRDHKYDIREMTFEANTNYSLFIRSVDRPGRMSLESYPVLISISPPPGPLGLLMAGDFILKWLYNPEPGRAVQYKLKVNSSDNQRVWNLGQDVPIVNNSVDIRDLRLDENRFHTARVRASGSVLWSKPFTFPYALVPPLTNMIFDRRTNFISWRMVESQFWKARHINKYRITVYTGSSAVIRTIEAKNAKSEKFHVVDDLALPIQVQMSLAIQSETHDGELSKSSEPISVFIGRKTQILNIRVLGINTKDISVEFSAATGSMYVRPQKVIVRLADFGSQQEVDLSRNEVYPVKQIVSFPEVTGEIPVNVEIIFIDNNNNIVKKELFEVKWARTKDVTRTPGTKASTLSPVKFSKYWKMIIIATSVLLMLLLVAMYCVLFVWRNNSETAEEKIQRAMRRLAAALPRTTAKEVSRIARAHNAQENTRLSGQAVYQRLSGHATYTPLSVQAMDKLVSKQSVRPQEEQQQVYEQLSNHNYYTSLEVQRNKSSASRLKTQSRTQNNYEHLQKLKAQGNYVVPVAKPKESSTVRFKIPDQ